MKDSKQVQIIIRTTQEEKDIIIQKAKEKGTSINEFIKTAIFSDPSKDDSEYDSNDNKNDTTIAIIEILREQLTAKDMQIANLQQIIYNRDTKLIESPKTWWQFWK